MSNVLVENKKCKNILNQRQITRIITRNTKANCNLEIYTCYLFSDSIYAICTTLSQIMDGIFHDSVNRSLLKENYISKNLFKYIESNIDKVNGVISLNNVGLDKPYYNTNKLELIAYYS